MNLVATSFATQPVCNVARTAHALRSDQFQTAIESYLGLKVIVPESVEGGDLN